MTHFEVNLIQGRVIPPWKRRLMLGCLVVYLLICLALLVTVVSGLVTQVEGGRELYRQFARTEKLFMEDHPKQGRLLPYMSDLRAKVDGLTRQLSATQPILGKRCDPVRILLRLKASLPRSATLSSLELDPDNGTIVFNLTVPVDEAGYTFSSSEIIEQWNADGVLQQEVSGIHAGGTLRQRMGGRTVFVVKFAGLLKRKES